MGTQVGSSFSLLSKQFLDEREGFKTLSEMRSFDTRALPDGQRTFVSETGKQYIYRDANLVDELTGKWRLLNEKGDPFVYEDFTPEQIANLQKPATDIANELKIKEEEWQKAEDDRQKTSAETIKKLNETDAKVLSQGNIAEEKGTEANKQALYAKEEGDKIQPLIDSANTSINEAINASTTATGNANEATAECVKATGNAIQATTTIDEKVATAVAPVQNEITQLWDELSKTSDSRWYGIRKLKTQASPDHERIGYLDNHRLLPYHNRIRPCVVNDDRTINYYLDDNDIRKKADGTPSKLDGTDGQVMVYYPAGYHILNSVPGNYEYWAVGLTPFSIEGVTAEYVPAFVVSMDYATVKRTGNILSCVISEDADYAGSGAKTTAGGLGYPRTAVSNYNYTLYARNRGAEWVNSFAFFELIKTSLMYIEFATYYLHKPFNPELSPLGYKQGGLGEGPWNWSGSDWSEYNEYCPVIKIGEVQLHLSDTGNTGGTGVYTRTFQATELRSYTTKFPCWRWCSNLYAHLWRWDAGVSIDIQPDASETPTSTVYMTKKPVDVLATNDQDFSFTEKYNKIGELTRTSGYSMSFIPGSTYQLLGGAGSTTYGCAYHWPNIPASRERRGFLSGASLSYGGDALRASAHSYNRPSYSNAHIGSGLSAYAAE